MTKNEALKYIEDSTTLNDKFEAAYNVLKYSPSIAQDKMLLLYAYYKQSTLGDFEKNENNTQISNYIQTFKDNARLQVRGMKKEDAMKKYIELTLSIVKKEF